MTESSIFDSIFGSKICHEFTFQGLHDITQQNSKAMTTVEGLLKRLKACENDSEKFALLIVISKVIKPDLMSPELQDKLSQAVSFKFVSRLLKVDSNRENSRLYWQIAVAVLKTCFLSEAYLTHLLGCADRLIEVSITILNTGYSSTSKQFFLLNHHSINYLMFSTEA